MPSALIVEDEPDIARVLAALVGLRGYDSDHAATGSEALDRVGRTAPDVVLLDLMLPDRHGFEVADALRARPSTAALPVVVVTARVTPADEARCYLAGAADFVPKPFTPQAVFDALEAADSWRESLRDRPDSGEIRLGPDPDGRALRALGRLRCQLLARPGGDPESVAALVSALDSARDRAVDWSRSRPGRPAASALASYRIGPDRLSIVLRDDSGWLADDPAALAALARSVDAFEPIEPGRVWSMSFGSSPDRAAARAAVGR